MLLIAERAKAYCVPITSNRRPGRLRCLSFACAKTWRACPTGRRGRWVGACGVYDRSDLLAELRAGGVRPECKAADEPSLTGQQNARTISFGVFLGRNPEPAIPAFGTGETILLAPRSLTDLRPCPTDPDHPCWHADCFGVETEQTPAQL